MLQEVQPLPLLAGWSPNPALYSGSYAGLAAFLAEFSSELTMYLIVSSLLSSPALSARLCFGLPIVVMA